MKVRNITFFILFLIGFKAIAVPTACQIGVCYNSTGANLKLVTKFPTGFTGTVYSQWQRRLLNEQNFVNISSLVLTNITEPAYYRLQNYTGLQGDPTQEAYSNIVFVDKPSIGAVENLIFESTPSGYVKLSYYTGTIVKWEMKQGSGSWVDIGNAGNDQYYIGSLTTTTDFRVQLTDCATYYSGIGTVTLDRKNFSGTIAGPDQIYTGTTANLTVTGYSGSIVRWEKQPINGNVATISSTSATISQSNITSSTYYRVVVNFNGKTENSPWFRVEVVSDSPTTSILSSNYTAVDLPIEAVTTETSVTSTNAIRSISFQDGLGRVVQNVVKGALGAGGKDIISFVDFDKYGATPRQFLPYAYTATAWDSPQQNNQSNQLAFYNGSVSGISANSQPYADVITQASPYSKVDKVGAPGATWSASGTHETAIAFQYNTSGDAIKLWNKDGTTTTNYVAGTLIKTTVTDEDENRTIVFKDKEGLVVCKKVEVQTNSYLTTYYIYDDYARLRYIIPPKASAVSSGLTYEFKYDSKGRLIEKSIPGAGWEYFVYDKRDRVVLSQNTIQRASNQWVFAKYDVQNRMVYSGIYTSASSRASLQTTVDGGTRINEKRSSGNHGYSNNVFPTTSTTIHQVLYYDNYDFDRNGTTDYNLNASHFSGQATSTLNSANKLPTGGKSLILDGGSNWLVSVMFYDTKGRVLQVISNNYTQLALSDITTFRYNNWTGTVSNVKHTTKIGANNYDVQWRYVYDRQNRVTQVFQRNANDTEVEVSALTYNELGQLTTKKIHKSGTDYLQQLDFSYNERGWLKQVNDPTQLSDPKRFFAFKLNYNATTSGVTGAAKYNGSIAGMEWSTYAGVTEAYGFTYDKADRLLSSDYGQGSSYTSKPDGYNETASWDANGNLNTLTRKEWTSGTSVATIDNLTTVYSANQLTRVNDAGDVEKGYPNATNQDNELAYNTSGFLTKDLNRNITNITYNHLSKPLIITLADGKTIQYTYAADGSKLKRELKDGTTVLENVKYVKNYYVLNDVVKHFSTGEGRTVVKTTSNTGAENQYYLTDHLGNIRTVFTSATPQVWTGVTATMETENAANEDNYWFNINRTVYSTANTTAGGNEVQTLDAAHRSGAGTVLEVFPGDNVSISVKSYYASSGTVTNTAAVVLADIASAIFTGAGGFAGEGFSAASISGGYGSGTILAGKNDSGQPKAYLNYLFYDRNFNYVTAGFKQVEGSGSRTLTLNTSTFNQPGYVFIYLTYESTSGYPVSFDDFTYTHNTTRVLASNAYYPFGMMSGQSWVRPENPLNRNLYNAGNERNEITGYDETFYRLYDPALGRFMGVDPLADLDPDWSPYAYGRSNPLSYNDPLGDQAIIIPPKLLEILIEYYKDKSDVYVSNLPGGSPTLSIPAGSWGGSYHSNGSREYFNSASDVVHWAYRNEYGDIIQAITKTKYYSYTTSNTRDVGGTTVRKVDKIVGVKINVETPLPSVITLDGYEDQASGGYEHIDGKTISISGTAAFLIAGATFEFGVIWDGSGDWAPFLSVGSAYGVDASIGVEVKNIYNNNVSPFRIGQYEGVGVSDNVGIGFVDFIYGGDVDLEDPWGFADHGHTYQEYGFGVSYGIPAAYTRQYVYTWVFDGK